MLVDLASRGVTGDVAAAALERAGLAVNKNLLPFDRRPPESPSGLRLSSNAGTTRGLGVGEFQSIGRWIDQVLRSPNDAPMILAIRDEVRELCRRHPIY
jgi:glycine hydroxymethyltransferase